MDDTLHDHGQGVGYQQAEWKAQRIAWVVMLVIILAAFSGVLGSSGPLAQATLKAPDGAFEIQYTRLHHHHAPASLTVTVSPAMVRDGEVQIWLDADYVRTLSIESITPEPESVDVGPDRLLYTFTVEPQDGPVDIMFKYEHDSFWWLEGRIGVEGGGSIEFRQFVYP